MKQDAVLFWLVMTGVLIGYGWMFALFAYDWWLEHATTCLRCSRRFHYIKAHGLCRHCRAEVYRDLKS